MPFLWHCCAILRLPRRTTDTYCVQHSLSRLDGMQARVIDRCLDLRSVASNPSLRSEGRRCDEPGVRVFQYAGVPALETHRGGKAECASELFLVGSWQFTSEDLDDHVHRFVTVSGGFDREWIEFVGSQTADIVRVLFCLRLSSLTVQYSSCLLLAGLIYC